MNILEKTELIKNQELKVEDNVENFIDIINKNNKSINAFLEINNNYALEKATEISNKIKNKEKIGSLAGLVFGIKANINVEDFTISAASKTLENYIGSYDATIIKKIKEEDGIIIGMTNLDEFAAGSSTESSYYGATKNPSAPKRISGGSSGGSAAAIADKMCDIAIGSDTGGSIRNPASHCGVIGFKPSYGGVSRQGLLDLSMSLDQIGPLSNDSSGIAIALNNLIDYDPHDCTSLKWDAPNFLDAKNTDDLKGKKIATIKQFHELSDEKINGIIDNSVSKIEDLGAEIVELEFNYLDLTLPTYYLINYVEFFSATRKYDGRKYGYKIEDVCGEEVLRRINMGSYISQQEFSGKYYKKALQARSLIKNEINKLFNDVDLIIGSTVPKLPHKIGDKLEPMEMYAYDVLTVIANLTGIPAGSIKAGESNGIPVGLQIQSKPQEDYKILEAMFALENSAV
ncbi:MAG: Asp-tRNA(Asn)/Glu-tRNA(Gln) amidotransferase subunit GatA [Methanobrevibacter sp.]|jgi:aspartyl-tRNA(Asn)/glutamyl-tRNA(Gln) amidotransferase subunit A|nr:Asp-tRNA(Asn)/Glu-tRNA(Gln) amidotransferase subunit GatA [Candidatus Methanovirga meridionalis]